MSDPVTRLNTALEGRYVIERELGEGGMATVHLAKDVKHNRNVALKVLKPELAAVVGAERFLAEIETTANLQHPHILPLFDSGEADGFLFYVMPYVEGETLRQRIERQKQLGVKESLAIATKVADALDYAHERGVVHRDIKPANILLSERGEPLVADFGIALAVAQAGAGRITETGLSLGTPHYMSPEQATGDRDIDPRSDVYALGCVLYEMLSGDPPFSASSAQAVLVKILTTDAPSITLARRTVPPHVGAVLAQALEKLPADRFTDAAGFAAALADEGFTYQARPRTSTATTSMPPPVAVQVARPWLRDRRTVAGMAVVVVLASLTALGWLEPTPAPDHATRSVIDMEDIEIGIREKIVVSPDGSRFAVIGTVDGQRSVYWRDAAEEHFRIIPGTEDAREGVSFSPEGDWVAYATTAPDALMKVSLSGGAPTPVVPAGSVNPRLPHWGDDGTIVFTGPTGMYRVPDTGGEPEVLRRGAEEFLNPSILPGGRAVIGSAYEGGVMLLDLETDSIRALIPGGRDPAYVETGHILYADASGGLWAQPFDLKRLELLGAAVPMFDGLTIVNWGPGNVARYSVSRNGTLVYGAGGGGGGGAGRQRLLVVDLEGTEETIPLDPRAFVRPKWSPDGASVAYGGTEPGEAGMVTDIYTYNVDLKTAPRPLTVEGGNLWPVWSPDGTQVAFGSLRDGTDGVDLFMKTVYDDAPPVLIVSLPGPQVPTQWPSNDLLVFETGGGQSDLWVVDLSSDPVVATPYLESEADLDDIMVSPDGTLAAYNSDETGREEIYVRSFPEPRQPETVSQGGGELPFWSPDGNTVYYWAPRRSREEVDLVAARIERGPPFVVTSRETVLTGGYLNGSADLNPDGDRLIATLGAQTARTASGEAAEPERFLVVVNWFEELKERMGG